MNEENALIRRIVEGDTESFGLLVERYRGPVMRMVRNMVGNTHACEDISQDVFLRAFRKLGAFDPALSRFSTWLFTITRNLSVNAFRKRAVPTMASIPESPDHSQPPTTVPKHHCFVLGDNRDSSRDSRTFGAVPLAGIIGRADFLYAPAREWSRFGSLD